MIDGVNESQRSYRLDREPALIALLRSPLESIQEHCRKHVAGYKVPRQLTLVDQMVRSPAGKSDYRWAKQVATTDGS